MRSNRLLSERFLYLILRIREENHSRNKLPPPNRGYINNQLKHSIFSKWIKNKGYGWSVKDEIDPRIIWAYIDIIESNTFEEILFEIEEYCKKNNIKKLLIRRFIDCPYQKLLVKNKYVLDKVMLRLEENKINELIERKIKYKLLDELSLPNVKIANPTESELLDYFNIETKIWNIEENILDKYWQVLFDRPFREKSERFWVAKLNGKVIGGNKILFYSWYQNNPANVMCGLSILPSFRRRGIAKSLLYNAIKYSSETNPNLELLIKPEKKFVYDWYIKIGFKETRYDWKKDFHNDSEN